MTNANAPAFIDLPSLRAAAEEALALAERATPGPWTWAVSFGFGSLQGTCEGGDVVWYTNDDDGLHAEPADSAFIAGARSTVPALARSVLALAEEVERLRGVLRSVKSGVRFCYHRYQMSDHSRDDLTGIDREIDAALRGSPAPGDNK